MTDQFNNPEATYRETLGPAMQITDQGEADVYKQKLIERQVRFGTPPEEAEKNVLTNLGYYAGYYDRETQIRVQILYGASHPIIPVGATSEEMLEMGKQLGGGQ